MKFRKTKLTALAMSVLMAASTITSVTWAADLFTDGAPAEVASEFVSEPEATAVDAEGESLLQEKLILNTGDTLVANVGFKTKEGTGTEEDKIVGTYTLYTVTGSNSNGYTFDSKPDQTIDAEIVNGSKIDATCTEGAKAFYQFTVTDRLGEHTYISNTAYIYHDPDGEQHVMMPTVEGQATNDGYLKVPGSPKLDHLFVPATYTIPSTCNRKGAVISISACSECGGFKGDGVSEDSTKIDTFEEALIRKQGKDPKTTTREEALKDVTDVVNLVKTSFQGTAMVTQEIPKSSAHSYKQVTVKDQATVNDLKPEGYTGTLYEDIECTKQLQLATVKSYYLLIYN